MHLLEAGKSRDAVSNFRPVKRWSLARDGHQQFRGFRVLADLSLKKLGIIEALGFGLFSPSGNHLP